MNPTTHSLDTAYFFADATCKQLRWKGGCRAVFFTLLPVLLMFSACDNTVGAGGSDDTSSTDTSSTDTSGPQSHEEMLISLGVNVANPPTRVDNLGNPIPDDWQPMGRDVKAFKPFMELYVAGLTGVVADKSQGIVDYSKEAEALNTVLFSEDGDDAWATGTIYKNSISGDMDGDGFDEIMTVYYLQESGDLMLRFVDYHQGNDTPEVQVITIAAQTGFELGVDLGFQGMRPCLAVGDVDSDGNDELLVAFDQLYILDDSIAAFAPIETAAFGDNNQANPICVATGDFDGDNIDEFVVTYTEGGNAFYSVYDSNLTTPFANMVARQAVNDDITLLVTSVASGDVDGDGFDEIILNGRSSAIGEQTKEECNAIDLFDLFCSTVFDYNYCTKAMYIVDDANNGFVSTSYKSTRQATGPNHTACNHFVTHTLDIDGDAKDEIFDGKKVLDDLTTYDPENADASWPVLYETATEAIEATVGDLNEDLRSDIVYTDEALVMRGVGMDSANTVIVFQEWSGAGNLGALTTANVDNDSPVLAYRFEQELLYTEPIILAVIASSPYYDGIGQETGGAITSFGVTESVETSTEDSFGFTVGTSVSFEQGVSILGIKIADVEFSTELEAGMDWRYGQGTALSKWTAYDCAPGEDKVVFASVPMDVYYYDVVSSSNPDFAPGSVISINVPRPSETVSVSRSYFNAHNGETQDIGADVLQHITGDPLSYPNSGAKTALLAGAGGQGYEVGPVAVGQGISETRIGMEITQTSTFGRDINASVTVSAAAGGGGVKVGVSAGFQYGFSYDLSTSSGMTFEGAVGDIPQSAYTAENKYQAGLFAYPHSFNETTFMVVNYWVDAL